MQKAESTVQRVKDSEDVYPQELSGTSEVRAERSVDTDDGSSVTRRHELGSSLLGGRCDGAILPVGKQRRTTNQGGRDKDLCEQRPKD